MKLSAQSRIELELSFPTFLKFNDLFFLYLISQLIPPKFKIIIDLLNYGYLCHHKGKLDGG